MFRKILQISLGFLASLLLVECILRFCPVATGYNYLPMNATNPVLRGSPFMHYVYSLGWSFRRVRSGNLNNEGFPATYDYGRIPVPPVLVVGDSYVQAAAVTPGKRLHEALSEKLQPVHAFALSRAGGSLPDYLSMIEWGVERYRPAAVVVVVALGDVDDSLDRKGGGYHFEADADGYVLRRIDRPGRGSAQAALNSSRLVRYLYDNLGLARRVQTGGLERQVTPEERRRIAGEFLAQLAQVVPPRDTILVFHRGRRDGSFDFPSDIDVLLVQARERGVQVLDLAPGFAAFEASTGRRIDFAPVDTHWNECAHAYVATELALRLRPMLAK
jgi:hypothetical protein